MPVVPVVRTGRVGVADCGRPGRRIGKVPDAGSQHDDRSGVAVHQLHLAAGTGLPGQQHDLAPLHFEHLPLVGGIPMTGGPVGLTGRQVNAGIVHAVHPPVRAGPRGDGRFHDVPFGLIQHQILAEQVLPEHLLTIEAGTEFRWSLVARGQHAAARLHQGE